MPSAAADGIFRFIPVIFAYWLTNNPNGQSMSDLIQGLTGASFLGSNAFYLPHFNSFITIHLGYVTK